MKILTIHNRYVEKGGEDTTVVNELSLLKNNDVQVDVVYFDNGGSKILQLLKFVAYPINVFSYFRMIRLINKHKPDIVHVHNFFYTGSPLILWAMKQKGVPFVITVQNFRFICPSTTLFYNGELYLESVKNPFSFKVVRDKVYRNSYFLTFWLYLSNLIHFKIGTFSLPDKYIFASRFSKDVFEKSAFVKYKEKFIVKYNFMEMNDLKHVNHGKKYFIFIGRFTEEKGIDLLLRAFDQDYKLIIIGDGPLKYKVVEATSKNENIEYIGFLQKEEILSYLHNARALIFPSIWYEGMPLTIIEAFSVATPVIASNLGAMSEMIMNEINGFHFEPNNIDDLKQKIRKLQDLGVEEYLQLRKSTASTFKEKYTVETNYPLLMNIYQSVIDQYK